MMNYVVKETVDTEQMLINMRKDSMYDIADTEILSEESLPDFSAISQIKAQSNPPKVPKMFVSGDCIFNCAYCGCRSGHEKRTAGCYANNPKALAELAVKEAIKNKHGVFISSAIYKNADYTEELIIETIKSMRLDQHYNGYIHAKIMPGTDSKLIYEAGKYADRLSVNIEVAKSEGYERIAKQKNKQNILIPMKNISEYIKEAKQYRGKFAKSQTTQLMAGSTGEDDRTIIMLANAMYKKYSLKRVYYTPFQYTKPALGYDLPVTQTPYWRMSRLYQADRLLQLYNFSPEEILPENYANLEQDIDPKASWALRNLDLFPVEINEAGYDMLIRIPGIGTTYAKRIIEARKSCKITFDIMKRMKISLKRCIYFITCGGKYHDGKSFDYPLIRKLVSDKDESISMLSEQLILDNMDFSLRSKY